jgi:hypothetical protein
VALLLVELERPVRAVEIWRTLFGIAAMPRELRVAWLGDAIKAAQAAKDLSQASAWEGARNELIPLEEKK